MLKSFIVALAIGVFAVTGVATTADAQSRPCIKAPKDNLPCPIHIKGRARELPQIAACNEDPDLRIFDDRIETRLNEEDITMRLSTCSLPCPQRSLFSVAVPVNAGEANRRVRRNGTRDR